MPASRRGDYSAGLVVDNAGEGFRYLGGYGAADPTPDDRGENKCAARNRRSRRRRTCARRGWGLFSGGAASTMAFRSSCPRAGRRARAARACRPARPRPLKTTAPTTTAALSAAATPSTACSECASRPGTPTFCTPGWRPVSGHERFQKMVFARVSASLLCDGAQEQEDRAAKPQDSSSRRHSNQWGCWHAHREGFQDRGGLQCGLCLARFFPPVLTCEQSWPPRQTFLT